MQMQATEPSRLSLLDTLREFLKAADRKTYMHRIIYIGDHTFPDIPEKTVQERFAKLVKEVNEKYCDEMLSGLLIYYPRYFCHMIEGSEDSVMKHLRILILKYGKYLNRMKLLTAYHHINQKFLPEWTSFTGKPPTLLARIDVTSDMEKTFEQVTYCVSKIYKLAHSLRPKISVESHDTMPKITFDDDDSTILSKISQLLPTASLMQPSSIKDTLSTLISYGGEFELLPEYNLIEFLLQSPYVEDLQSYVSTYEFIPEMDLYQDKVWPVPSDLVPYDVFDKPIDPVIDLPPRQAPVDKSELLLLETNE